MPSETTPAEPTSAGEPCVDAVGAHLTGAFLAALVLILPLRAALGTTTYGGLYGWFLAAVVMVVLLGLLHRMAGVPHALGLALTSAGAFAVAVLITLEAVALIGAPGDDTSAAMLAGIPAAAVAAPVAAATVRWARDATGATALGATACVLGFVIAVAVGPTVGEQVFDARDDAEQIEAFEAAGLTAYLPEIDGTTAEFSSTSISQPEGGVRAVSGYSLRYEPESATDQDYDTAYISVDVALAASTPACEEIADYLTCREGDGYVVTERDGVAEEVAYETGGMRLRATFSEGTGDLPDIDQVGQALADVDEVPWGEVVGLED